MGNVCLASKGGTHSAPATNDSELLKKPTALSENVNGQNENKKRAFSEKFMFSKNKVHPDCANNQRKNNNSKSSNKFSAWQSFRAMTTGVPASPLGSTTTASNKTFSNVSSEKENLTNRTMPVINVFDPLVDGSDILVTNAHVRAAFVKFIQKKGWIETLTKPLAAVRNSTSSKKVKDFGGNLLN